jgi:methionyl-tRNA synthetase
LAREADVYLGRKAPWFRIKEDPAAAATTVYVILCVVVTLKTFLVLILPHTAQQLHEYLGYDGQLSGTPACGRVRGGGTQPQGTDLPSCGRHRHLGAERTAGGQALREPAPLFKKLDESVIEEEYARLDQ